MATLSALKQDDEPDGLRERFTLDLDVARKYTNPIHQLMDKYYEMYRNRWSDDSAQFQVSDLYAYVETVVPILTNNRTRVHLSADVPDVTLHAQGMGHILDNIFDTNKWDYKAQRIARMAEIYRAGMAYVGYDTEAKNGTGQLSIKEINIRWAYLDPSPTEFEESQFFFYVEPSRASKITKMYPDKAQDIKDSVGRTENNMGGDKTRENGWFRSWIRSIKNMVTFSTDNKSMSRLGEYQTLPELTEEEKRKGSVALIHYWYRDDEDNWRCSYWADDVFLEDVENPFWHGKLPYVIYCPTEDPLSSIGVPMAEHIENLNYEKNIFMQLIIENAKRQIDPVLLYNTAAGIKDPKRLRENANQDGVVGINNPDFVPLNALATFFVPPGLPANADSMPERFNAMEDRITGVNDSFRGMSEATSGKEVQLKQEAAYTRIKTKVDNFEKFVMEISERTIVNAMQFLNKYQAYRVKGDYTKYEHVNEQPEAPFEVKPIQAGVDPQTGQAVNDRKEFFLYANPHEWTQVMEEMEGESTQESPTLDNEEAPPSDSMDEDEQAEPDTEEEPENEPGEADTKKAFRILQLTVKIEAGSSLPTSPMARKEESAELFQMGVIDQQALLESYEYPNAEEIIKRMQEAAQVAQQAQQQAEEAKLQQQMQIEQAKMQQQATLEQQKLQQEASLKKAEMEHQKGMAQMNAQAKQQPQQQDQPDVASGLDRIRQAVPELANVPDDQLMALVAGMK